MTFRCLFAALALVLTSNLFAQETPGSASFLKWNTPKVNWQA